jgi:hypothetical protein
MDRKFAFLGEHTEDGFLVHDRDEVRQCLLDLEGAVFQLGGIVTMSSIREQVGPDQYATTGVLIKYDSFAPARVRETEEVAES